MREAPFELGVGAAQGGLGVDFEMAGKIDRREQEVANLIRQRLRRTVGDLRLDLGDLLGELRQNRPDIVPVETDFAGSPCNLSARESAGSARGTPSSAPGSASAGRPRFTRASSFARFSSALMRPHSALTAPDSARGRRQTRGDGGGRAWR